MVAPFGRRTVKGVQDLTLFKHGTLTKRKWQVQPDSTIAVSCCSRRGGVRQTSNLNYYLKLPPRHIILCWPDCLPCYRIELPPFCGRVRGVASEARVRFTNLVAMCPTVIACRGVYTSWSSIFTLFLIEQSLQFP
jgi:hypothetical protein